MSRWIKFVLIAVVLIVAYWLPLDYIKVWGPVDEAVAMLQDYARHHVLLCLVPAFFIAGAIAVFVSQASVMKYLGARANKALAYGVASVSGTVLAVCSCTVLPLFAGIYRMGAGLGPATAFLYSGPAINVLAIILTARVLGMRIGIARAVGAVLFSIVIGLLMHLVFRKKELERAKGQVQVPQEKVPRPLWQMALYFATMVGILVFANWSKPQADVGFWSDIYAARWYIAGSLGLVLAFMLIAWFSRGQLRRWCASTWEFALMILPLLFIGVLIAGLLLGRPGHEGLIPSRWVASAVGGNSLRANLFASVAAAFMYFATLTEVPILQGLLGAGMGTGPALALLLAGPALSLPNMLVIRKVLGTTKTVVYILLVIVMAALAGVVYGKFFG